MTIEIRPTQSYCGFVVAGGALCFEMAGAPATHVIKKDHRLRVCDRHAEEARAAGLKLESIEVLWR